MAKTFNPITETYRGKSIRKYNKITIRVSETEYKDFIDAKMDYGLTEKEVLKMGVVFCDPCKNSEIVKDSNLPNNIKKGIIFK